MDETIAHKTLPFWNKEITLYSSVAKNTFNIRSLLRDTDSYHGDYNVTYLLDFQDVTLPLIGTYNENVFGTWNEKELEKEHIFVYEYYFDEAKRIVEDIKLLAQKLITNASLYDDKVFCTEYFQLVKQGYVLVETHKNRFVSPTNDATPISLERAGLVCTRAAKQLEQNATIPNEIRVIAKRTHLTKDPENYLSVSITWRDKTLLQTEVKNKTVEVSDTVIASGASIAACIVAAIEENAKPAALVNRSIIATKQGVRLLQQSLHQLNVPTTFLSLGIAEELNSAYYLVGERAVGDAGQVLRHFLPSTEVV